MWLDYGTALCQPDVFDRALAARRDELSNVKIRSCLTMRPRAVLEADPDGEHFHWFSLHFSGYDRAQHDAGRCNYIPLNLGEIPDYYRRFIDPVDIVILKTLPDGRAGLLQLQRHQPLAPRASSSAPGGDRRGEPGPAVRRTANRTACTISEVDYVIDGDDEPAPELPQSAAE